MTDSWGGASVPPPGFRFELVESLKRGGKGCKFRIELGAENNSHG